MEGSGIGSRSYQGATLIEQWQVRIYCAAFMIALGLYLVVEGLSPRVTLLLVCAVAMGIGVWRGRGAWIKAGVVGAVAYTIVFPLLAQTIDTGQSFASVVTENPVWPQLLVSLVGSRVLAAETALSFAEFWRRPGEYRSVELQSTLAAAVLGCFFTLVFYLIAPRLVPAADQGAAAFIAATIRGGTFVHTTIIFLFFVIIAAIVDAAWRLWKDQVALARFGRLLKVSHGRVSAGNLRSMLEEVRAADPQSRAARLLLSAVDLAENKGGGTARLDTVSFDSFHLASRRFVRALLPFLPLLGFLGTVIGLATAIAGLPHGGADGAQRGFDVSASLAGLAIKFETTFLGLVASIVSSFLLNILEKHEAELAAACLLTVKAAMADGVRGSDV